MLRGASTEPVMKASGGAKNISLRNLHWRDNGSSAGQTLIELDAVEGFSVGRADCYIANDYKFVECVNNRSTQVSIRDIYEHSGGAASMVFMCAYLLVDNTNADISFVTGNNDALLNNIVGAINTLNSGGCTIANQSGGFTDAGGLAVLRTSQDLFTMQTIASATQPTLSDAGQLIWHKTTDDSVWLVARVPGVGTMKAQLT